MSVRELTYAKAVCEALRQAMARDPRVFLMGEDVGVYGGIFHVTDGLLEEFGEERVIDTPISEVALPGIACGAAMNGMRPVLEIMFGDFLTLAMDGIVNQAAKTFYMSGGKTPVPLVVRTTGGAGGGAGAQHSQSLHGLFMHFPGLKIAIPSTPYDAKGLLLSAIEDNNPVLFVEDRMLYGAKGEVPEEYYTIPFGQAAVRRQGEDVTVVATFGMVAKALAVAGELAREGISIEVIDPRTLFPLDKDTIIGSVKKTGRLVTVDEGYKTSGVGSEIAAIVAEEAVEYLQAPIMRVAAPMVPVPGSPVLEKAFIPDEGNIKEAIDRVLERS